MLDHISQQSVMMRYLAAVRGHSRALLSLLLIASAVLGCAAPATPTPTPVAIGGRGLTFIRPAALLITEGGTGGMRFALSQGSEVPIQPTTVPAAQTEPLSPEEIQAVLDRLPPLAMEPEDKQEFRLPPETLPAPRPGETIQQPFPPPAEVEPGVQPPVGPLKVLRYSPEGNVDLAPFLSITFDQPMVPLTAHADLAAKDVPVKLSPLPEGSWRWVGTKTLLFEPTFRFPMATQYTVEIPAGTTSAIGGRLEETITWTFTTPPPRVQSTHPSAGPQVRDPLMFVAFDQRIDPTAVLKTIQVKAGGKVFPITLASREDVETNEEASRLAKDAGEGRWLAFRCTERLPYDTTVTVDIGPGTPSAEGPLTTDTVQSFSFTTYGPLRVLESKCGWEAECRPMMPWLIRFSNPLNEDAFDESLVQIEPELPEGKLWIMDDTLHIEGLSKGRTTYRVTLKAGISDQFGQTLGKDETVTFQVGSAEPTMYVPWDNLVVIDPASKPTYSIFTINYNTVHVRVYAVKPEDWPQYLEYLQKASRSDQPGEPPGRRVMDQKVPITGELDSLIETPIDLSPALEGGKGHAILIVEADQASVPWPAYQEWKPVIRVWIQATNIGLDAFVDQQHMTAWANSLKNGAPLQGVELTLFPGKVAAKTGSDGLAKLTLPSSAEEKSAYLVAKLGDDTALLPESTSWWGRGWRYGEIQDQLRWYVFDDRQMYRPGEEVHVKGWVRLVGMSEGADVLTIPEKGTSVFYEVTDSRGNRILENTVYLNALGGFDLSFKLPETMNLGYTTLRFTLGGTVASGAEYHHSFQVQEFRRPEFEVSTRISEGPYFVGEHATATVEAKYYAGGPLANAEVTWNVTSQPGTYRPPNWDDFTFGIWIPWWRGFSRWGIPEYENIRSQTFTGTTDAAGKHSLRIDFEAVDPPQPTNVTVEASVMDVNRQAWSASTQILVHPADLYVGLRTSATFYEKGKPIKVDAIVTDLDGNPVADRPIEIRAVRLDWRYVKGEWREEELDEQRCTVGSQNEPVSCTFETPQGGTYRITATITDGKGRRNLTQITRWVSGGKQPSTARVEQEEVDLIPNRQEYQPGDTAEILVQSPFVPAEGLLTLRRAGIIYTERFRMDESTYTLRIPIKEAYIPNVHVQVDLVGVAPRLNSEGEVDESLPKRPAFATGSLDLSVPAYSRTLSLQVTPREKELAPGGETVVDVTVKDASGRPVQGAELAVVVVDEAILSLTNYQLADPIATFYQRRDSGVADYHLRAYVLLIDPSKLAEQAQAYQARAAMPMAPVPTMLAEKSFGAEAPGAGLAAQPIQIRMDFNPLATFEPEVPTDADGHASVRVKLPDNLTRYRVMVVAVAGDKEFGKGESTITTRLPLMVRPSPPRFLNFGDQFELPLVVQNQTDEPMQVDVVVRATNMKLLGSAGQRLTVPARDRREVRFPFTTDSAGTAHFQVAAVSGSWADAAEFSLPVYTPATTEAFAVYGTVDEGAIAQPVLAPSDVYTQFGGLDISTSSTALQALTDAVLYLVEYPFECSEQIASRILAIAALRDVLSAFQAEGLPKPEELLQAVQRDIETLQGIQNMDGGFPVWQRGRDSWPFHSIHATHALIRAKQKGFAVPDEMLSRALNYVRAIEDKFPSWYSKDVRNTLIAYALYVRTQVGDADIVRARKLLRDEGVTGLQPEALGWLLYVLSGDPQSTSEVAEIRRFLNNRVVETAGAASFTTSYREEDGYLLLASDRRADGVILEALIKDQPQSDLIPKIVRGLLAHRTRGKWSNTQENVFILLALDKYFSTYEAQTPEFVARVWLGDQYVAGFNFVGRTTEYQAVQVPMWFLAQREGMQNLILSKEGPGRLYYRLGIRYAPKDLELEPMEQGFTVLRTYEAVDNPQDVRRDEEGVWHIRAGARVRVRLTMVAPARRYHVALTDPLPAGFEALNPALAVTGSIPQDPADQKSMRYWWWRWTWYEHQNLRDQRAEAFASLLWEGIHNYTYVARATTPGKFVVPPPKAEEMYSPEVFGRGATDWVVVE
ncbi:MAG: Ig-like domain-containing protein [Chloroflexi bacterium]|nr:Ig-like domain-containing protein [Chloroflexota bacterium]